MHVKTTTFSLESTHVIIVEVQLEENQQSQI